jgi:hypothetical protein
MHCHRLERCGVCHGETWSSDFPTTPGTFDPSFNGNSDTFVVKLNATGSALTYATFLGGSGCDAGYGIAIDSSGAAYVTGDTYSSDFPTTPGAFDTSYNGVLTLSCETECDWLCAHLRYLLGGKWLGLWHGHCHRLERRGVCHGHDWLFRLSHHARGVRYEFQWRYYDAFVVKLNATVLRSPTPPSWGEVAMTWALALP